jgi:F-type H+-transporting ATPase subunit a
MADDKPDPFHHVADTTRIDTFETIGWGLDLVPYENLPSFLQPFLPYGLSKLLVLEFIAAALIIILVVPVCRRLRNGEPPKGRWANAVEAILLFIRDEVARPSIPDVHHHTDSHGHIDHSEEPGESHPIVPDYLPHRADHYLPLLWTLFLFILFANLLGMLPFSGSPTASLMVTGALSLIAFVVIHTAGLMVNGPSKYFKSFVPHVEGDDAIMKILKWPITIGVAGIEIMSLFIRNFVLAVRLFANMVGGHAALAMILLFIQIAGKAAAPDYVFWPITLGSVILVTAMSVLELFVALLQAYVFTMLTATFIGLAVNPEH